MPYAPPATPYAPPLGTAADADALIHALHAFSTAHAHPAAAAGQSHHARIAGPGGAGAGGAGGAGGVDNTSYIFCPQAYGVVASLLSGMPQHAPPHAPVDGAMAGAPAMLGGGGANATAAGGAAPGFTGAFARATSAGELLLLVPSASINGVDVVNGGGAADGGFGGWLELAATLKSVKKVQLSPNA